MKTQTDLGLDDQYVTYIIQVRAITTGLWHADRCFRWVVNLWKENAVYSELWDAGCWFLLSCELFEKICSFYTKSLCDHMHTWAVTWPLVKLSGFNFILLNKHTDPTCFLQFLDFNRHIQYFNLPYISWPCCLCVSPIHVIQLYESKSAEHIIYHSPTPGKTSVFLSWTWFCPRILKLLRHLQR